jgi:predicted NAD/FAD-binding protein
MKIAIIGSGISGVGLAWLLNNHHQITVFEKNSYVGGHANTVEIDYPLGEKTKKIAVDTGFIVYNFRTYHHLKKFFEHLKVGVKESVMSFGVSCDDGFEYSGASLGGLFADKKNLLKPKFWRMLFDIFRFNFRATKLVLDQKVSPITLSQFVEELGLGEYFKKYYLFPMAAAIWSCPMELMKNYPAQQFLRFFYNHGLLTVFNQPTWYTVDGGSREYLKKATINFSDKIRLNCGAKKISPQKNGKIILSDSTGENHEFDQIVFACHADEALEIITKSDLVQNEIFNEILGKFKYSKNVAILHHDSSQMPKNKAAWASWVYLHNNKIKQVSLTYWMNNLQNIDKKFPLFVTLNPKEKIAPNLVFGEYIYHHPIFDLDAIEAQKKLDKIQGKNNLWFCGAYTRFGFHEDGLLSAINIANKFNISAPWQ